MGIIPVFLRIDECRSRQFNKDYLNEYDFHYLHESLNITKNDH